VKLKKLEVVAIDAIEAAANMNWAILRISPVRVPGVPAKFFIFLPQIITLLITPFTSSYC